MSLFMPSYLSGVSIPPSDTVQSSALREKSLPIVAAIQIDIYIS